MDKPQLKDHRQIGQELELFFTHELAPGAAFWLPKGMIIFKELEKYIRDLTVKAAYQETSTPILIKNEIFRQSGHWDKFGQHKMFNMAIYEEDEILEIHRKVLEQKKELINKLKDNSGQPISESITIKTNGRVEKVNVTLFFVLGELGINPEVNYTLKPMNCPESTLIYRFKPRSYRELPLRISELGRLFRREQSGEIGGLLRVRQFVMDDAHIYAREKQVKEEVSKILDTMETFYKSLGFKYDFRLATRPEKDFAGTKEMWDKAEGMLKDVLKAKKIKYTEKEGEGAFYGPKIDLHIQAINKDWQLATVQIDLYQPQAFELQYVNEEGKFEQPVMIHRAIFGSFERFMGILTEHFQGAFPVWLSPVQVEIIPITNKHNSYGIKILDELRENGIRAEFDEREDTMQSKVRDATLQKVPYMVIIGDKEIEKSNVSVRARNGKKLGSESLSDFVKRVKESIDKKI